MDEKKKEASGVEPGSAAFWELVRQHAFRIWEKRCQEGLAGDECSDWLQAEREVSDLLAARRRE